MSDSKLRPLGKGQLDIIKDGLRDYILQEVLEAYDKGYDDSAYLIAQYDTDDIADDLTDQIAKCLMPGDCR